MKRFIEGDGTCKSNGIFSNELLPTTHQLPRTYSRQLVHRKACDIDFIKMESCRLEP